MTYVRPVNECRNFFVYYESRKRELKTKPTYECRIKTRLITEKFASVMGEYVFW